MKQSPVTKPPSLTTAELAKSPNDKRQYEALTLNNGLKVLLISDAKADEAAASLYVHIGQFSDPQDRQGLAHFLEHMLFMGTEKYPDVDDYRKFIKRHGGQSNAGTGQEYTGYFFSIDHEHLEGALDRFAQFFIAPKLDPNYVQRERKAVHSEYSLKIKTDVRRFREVRRKTSNPAHPFSKFSVGNLDTLADREGQPVWDDLKKFYDKHYSASRMSLAVLGRQSLSDLRAMVEQRFAKVRSDNQPKVASTAPAFLPEQLGAIIKVVPLAKKKNLRLEFLVPSALQYFDRHPIELLSSLLGHEGQGSLYAYLKSKGWVERLQAGGDGADDHSLLYLSIALTDQGYQNWEQVTSSVFQYIRLMRESKSLASYYMERQTLADQQYRFKEAAKSSTAVRSAAYRMMLYPQRHVLDLQQTYAAYDSRLIDTYLAALEPNKVRVFLTAKGLPTDKVEPLYQTPYSIASIPKELIQKWIDSPSNPKLSLPRKNAYISTKLDLLKQQDKAPAKVVSDELVTAWLQQDTSFGVPRAQFSGRLYAPIVAQSPKNKVLNLMFTSLLADSFEEQDYPLRLAGLSFAVKSSWEGMSFSMKGYNEKQEQLWNEKIQHIRQFKVAPERFEIIRNRLLKNFENRKADRPIYQGISMISALLDARTVDDDLVIGFLKSSTSEELQSFIGNYFQQGELELLIVGNQDRETVKRMSQKASEVLLKGMKKATRPVPQIRQIPAAKETAMIMDIQHKDSIYISEYQGKTSTLKEQAHYLLLANLLKTPFFTELRTKQQLGYTVWAYYVRRDRLPGVRFAIQSPVLGPKGLQRRIQLFVRSYHDTLSKMPAKDFAASKQGLISTLQVKDSNLSNRFGRLQQNLVAGYLGFDRKKQLSAIINTITQDEIVQFYQQRLLDASNGRLVVQSIGEAHQGKEKADKKACKTRSCVESKLPVTLQRP